MLWAWLSSRSVGSIVILGKKVSASATGPVVPLAIGEPVMFGVNVNTVGVPMKATALLTVLVAVSATAVRR